MLGGYKTQKLSQLYSLECSERFPSYISILKTEGGEFPLFLHCGAYRATLKLKVLGLYAFSIPKNPIGV